MSNETEKMPEKIWVSVAEEGYLFIPKFIGFADDELTPYTRTDTIPSRAQVAREFMEEAAKRADRSLLPPRMAAWQCACTLLAEWEEADGKR